MGTAITLAVEKILTHMMRFKSPLQLDALSSAK